MTKTAKVYCDNGNLLLKADIPAFAILKGTIVKNEIEAKREVARLIQETVRQKNNGRKLERKSANDDYREEHLVLIITL